MQDVLFSIQLSIYNDEWQTIVKHVHVSMCFSQHKSAQSCETPIYSHLPACLCLSMYLHVLRLVFILELNQVNYF